MSIIDHVRELAKKEYDKNCHVKDDLSWSQWVTAFNYGYSYGYTDAINKAVEELDNKNKSNEQNRRVGDLVGYGKKQHKA